MLVIRSLIFLLLQIIITPVFALLALLTFPFSRLTRYRFISLWAKMMLPILRLVCGIRHEVRGIENLPKQPCIVMCKHQSAWETLALQKIFPPQVWVLKRELLWIPFFGWALALTSPIAIKLQRRQGCDKAIAGAGQAAACTGILRGGFPRGDARSLRPARQIQDRRRAARGKQRRAGDSGGTQRRAVMGAQCVQQTSRPDHHEYRRAYRNQGTQGGRNQSTRRGLDRK